MRRLGICLGLVLAGCAGGEVDDVGPGDELPAGRRCSARNVSDTEIADVQAKVDRVAPEGTLERQPASNRIRVYVHVVYDPGAASAAGMVSREQVQQQIAAMNDAFGGLGGGHNTAHRFFIQDAEADIDYTASKAWSLAVPDSAAEIDMKTALRRGGVADLNLYLTNPGEGLLGWATFPWDYKTSPLMDGVVILYSSLPGGGAAPYDEGDTAVHEVGHWLGLLHTFQGGCDGEDSFTRKGDYVTDTPRVASPTFGCPAPQSVDTCTFEGKNPLKDLVENYMDYTDDLCMFGFTHGQSKRMNGQWKTFRGAADPVPPACGDSDLDPGELCDPRIEHGQPGACPTEADCNDDMACTVDEVIGNACEQRCHHTAITQPKNGDGCCPDGANAGNDNDCATECGDGMVTPPETCDIALPQSCPTSCDDGQACTDDTLVHGGSCAAACTHVPITGPAHGDGCCPSGANNNTDNDCAPRCGNGVEESGEGCDDGNTSDGDGCDASCQVEAQRDPRAFRLTSMHIRDPHAFYSFGGCKDITDDPLFSGTDLAVNIQINKQLTTDSDGDGNYDLSGVLLLDPLDQSDGGASDATADLGAVCRADNSGCTRGAQVYRATATSHASGLCLGKLAGTTNAAYPLPVNQPTNQCFATSPTTIALVVQGSQITLRDAQIAAVYQSDPATGLSSGLIRGFLTTADAEATNLNVSGFNINLAGVLPGGKNACKDPAPATGDRDVGPGGADGWWFYVNYTAQQVDYQ